MITEDGCPETFAVCFLPEDASALADYLTAMERYAQEAWRLCGKGN